MNASSTPSDIDARAWTVDAIARLHREAARSADTHLLHAAFPGLPGIDFYFKDEASHPTGSLKHRLARSLFLYALCNGRLLPGQPVVDASSGSTAISEAWFARLLGLSFTAVMPASTAPAKIEAVHALGGHCELTGPHACPQARAREIAARGACFLDQFGLAERATDWRGNNNIAESIIGQLQRERFHEPAWIVCGAGTGGTSATIGRYLRYRGMRTRLCVAEPTGMAFARAWQTRDHGAHATHSTCIEGIGRPNAEPGFLFEVVDKVVEVPDAASIAGAQLLEHHLGRRYGGSSGTNLVACLQLAKAMLAQGEQGSIVSLLCDRGERYDRTLFDPQWRSRSGINPAPWLRRLHAIAGDDVQAPGADQSAASPAGTATPGSSNSRP